MIKKYFCTWSTWPSGPHHPKIIVSRNSYYFIIGKPCYLFPQQRSLLICMINSYKKSFFRNIKFFCNQFPCKWYCVRLKVIPKAEVTQHFKKSMMTSSVANIIKIIMFTTCSNTFLRGYSAFIISCFYPSKQIFKLHHARISKHQCRVISGHQWTRLDNFVSLPFKII